MSRLLRRLRLGVALLATAIALAGCVTLPGSSGVNQGRSVGGHSRLQAILSTPAPPQPGMSQEEIANGYLLSMLGAPQVPNIVREFLTPAARREWHPNQLLVVYTNSKIETGKKGRLRFAAQQLGSIDNRGSWVSASTSSDELLHTFQFERVDGEWRIDNPLPGTLLDTDAFERYYREYSLFYFDGKRQILVPDPVYQLQGALNQNQIATALVRNLLAGPTAAMDGAVAGVVPRGTRLTSGVTVSSTGLADIHLSPQVSSMSGAALNLFAAQLSWTLRQGRLGISHIRVLAGNRPIPIPGLGEFFPAPEGFTSFDPSGFPAPATLYAISKHEHTLVTFSSPGYVGPFAVTGNIGNYKKARAAAISVDASTAALVSSDGTYIRVGAVNASSNPPQTKNWIGQRHDLLKPSWDATGLLWAIDRVPGEGAKVLVSVSRASTKEVDAPGISGEDVVAFAVSRDGARLAAIIRDAQHTKLVVAMIRRGTSPTDVTVTGARPISNVALRLDGLSALSWYSPTVLAVLANGSGGEPQPYLVSIDGSRVHPTTGLLPVVPVTLTTGANPHVPPVIATSHGALYVRAPNDQWALIVANADKRVTAPTYPG